tara:strand:- start:1314 stop:2063 length:750 start_codon:yes stop_codon:yes gene_type:complete
MNNFTVHQVYGLYDDGKPLSDNELFMESHLKYKEICDKNNYKYKLWNKNDCDELVNKYEFVKKYYHNVRHKIMKVDIIRFLILFEYGGLYSDLDVIPNINNFDFIINQPDKIFISHYYWTPQADDKKIIMDMEVISTVKPLNLHLLNYLIYIPTQIEEKNKIKIYDNWKIRYIFQTTGPPSFRRFLKENRFDKDIEHLITCGIKKGISFKEIFNNEEYGNKQYQFLSYFSLSYKQQLHGNKNVEYKKKK